MRWLAALVFIAGGVALAQSALPAIGPPAAPTPPIIPAPAPPPEHRPQVSYQQGRLLVIADNSSLNQILRDIARQTGMKISGGVTDQQVYGTYGPGAPAEILATLLDGTNSNMVLRETPASAPTELILTPQLGGAAPSSLDVPSYTVPGPSASYERPDYNAQRDARQDRQDPEDRERSADPANPPQPNVIANPPPTLPPATESPTDPQSPNGVRTPQQIYEQLQKLQQAQPQPASQ